MSLGARSTFTWLGWLVPLLGFSACSSNESGANDLPQSAAGALSAGSANLAGTSAQVNLAGASAQSGTPASAGSGGSDANASSGGVVNAGASGFAGSSGAASVGGASSAGSAGSGGTAGALGAAGSSAAFAAVSSILGSNCGIKGCHADKQSPHFVPGPLLYATLTGPNTVLAECGYTKFVEAGDPAKSALVRLMNRQCDGFTMPPSCNQATCLAAADLKALSDWIQAGAPP